MPPPSGGGFLPGTLQGAGGGPQAVSTASKHTGAARVGGEAAGPAARIPLHSPAFWTKSTN